MRHGKSILNVDKAHCGEMQFLLCCWDDCERDGTNLHRTRFHDHPKALRCDDPVSKHVWYVFCSERHLRLFLNGHREYGVLPSGDRGRIL